MPTIRRGDTNSVIGLCTAIEEYGNIFSYRISCSCLQDLRPYVELMVQKSSSCEEDGKHVPNEVLQMMDWTKSIRETNNPFVQLGDTSFQSK
jgi:energy-converting hydrogenase A subunit M